MDWQEFRLNPLTVKAFVYKRKEYPKEVAEMVERGKCAEYQLPDGSYELRFKNKRSSHNAREGDVVVLDEFGYLQLYTERWWQYRAKEIK